MPFPYLLARLKPPPLLLIEARNISEDLHYMLFLRFCKIGLLPMHQKLTNAARRSPAARLPLPPALDRFRTRC